MGKILLIRIVCFISVALFVLPCSAVTLKNPQTGVVNSSQGTSGASATQGRIRKTSALVDKIEGNTFFTNKGTFDLTNVHVVDLSGKRKNRGPKEKLVLEMTFVNDTLREAIIH